MLNILKKGKITIGRKDKADFPEWNLHNMDIKIDTGAYTSAIHCHKIEEKTVGKTKKIFFTLLDPSHAQYEKQAYTTENYQEKMVKNSFGISEKRYVIHTKIFIFNKEYPIELSLSERGEMKFPILIGRKFLMKKFIVDPAKFDLSYKKKKTL